MERKEGINPAYDVRTDRFDLALEATDHIQRSKIAEREKRQNEKKIDLQGTGGNEPAA